MYYLNDVRAIPTAWVVLVRVLLLTLLAGAVVAAFWRSRRPVNAIDIPIWFFGTGLITLVVIELGDHFPETARPFVYGYVPFTWIVAAFGIYTTWMRLRCVLDERRTAKANRSQVLTSMVILLGVGFFIALVLTGVERAEQDTWAKVCRHNLRKIGLAFEDFQVLHGKYPGSSNGNPPHSWRIAILPFLDDPSLYKEVRFRVHLGLETKRADCQDARRLLRMSFTRASECRQVVAG